MYFKDLTPYQYKLPFALHQVLNVGWLNADHDYPKGSVSATVTEKLSAIIEQRGRLMDAHTNVVRGIHHCNLCDQDDVFVEGAHRRFVLGMSEIWLPSAEQTNRWYASPSMVLHYINEHHYLPPEEFIHAVSAFALDQPFQGQAIYDQLVAEKMAHEK